MTGPEGKSTAPKRNGVLLSVQVDAGVKERLERLAVRNERTLSGEVKLALRRYLAECEAAA